MQSAGIVDVVDEGADLALGVFAAAIGLAVDLLGFERMHEALGLGVVLRRSWAAHAGVGADLAQPQGVVAAGVLHAAVGMIDQVLQRTATRGDGLVERLERQAGLQMIVVSGELGAAKPDAGPFDAAVQALGSDRRRTWHVGDNLDTDVQGARNAGLIAVWLNRHGRRRAIHDPEPNIEVASLSMLVRLLRAADG